MGHVRQASACEKLVVRTSTFFVWSPYGVDGQSCLQSPPLLLEQLDGTIKYSNPQRVGLLLGGECNLLVIASVRATRAYPCKQ